MGKAFFLRTDIRDGIAGRLPNIRVRRGIRLHVRMDMVCVLRVGAPNPEYSEHCVSSARPELSLVRPKTYRQLLVVTRSSTT